MRALAVDGLGVRLRGFRKSHHFIGVRSRGIRKPNQELHSATTQYVASAGFRVRIKRS